MKPSIHSILLVLILPVLAGCLTTSSGPPKEKPLSQPQMERALQNARPPQQFGFTVYRVKDGVHYNGAGRLHPNHFVSVNMLEDGIPAIGMRGRAKRNRLTVLIDTSSPVSWMEHSTAKDFGVFFMGANGHFIPYRGTYNTGGIPAFAGIITQMRIENLFIENMPFYIRMSNGSLGPLARGIYDPHLEAIVGYDNLKVFEYVQIDLHNNTVNFSSTTPYTPIQETPPDAALIVKAPGHGLAIEGMIDGKPVPVLLDMAGDFSLARGDVKVSTTRKLQVGDLEFSEVPTLLLPVHEAPPRIGRKLLESYIITICNREGLVYFEKMQK